MQEKGPKNEHKLVCTTFFGHSAVLLYYEARNDCTNNSKTILLCNRCILIIKLIPRQLMRVIGTCARCTLWRRLNYPKQFLPESPV